MSDADNGDTDKNDSDGEGGSEGGSILDEGGIDTDERAGRSLGIEPGQEPDDDTKEEMEEERERRLDPDNRPEGAEVDNTERTFDVERGMYTDSEDYDESEPAPFKDPENPNNEESEGGADDDADDDADDGADDDKSGEADEDEGDKEDDS